MYTLGIPYKGEHLTAHIVYDEDGEPVCMVFGLPTNCRLSEVENDERWADGLARGRMIVDALNAYDGKNEGVK